MDNKRLKIAVIGAGYWGKNLLRVFHKLGVPDTVCYLDRAKLKQIRNDYKEISTISSFSSVLKDKSIHAVAISTPAESHYRLVDMHKHKRILRLDYLISRFESYSWVISRLLFWITKNLRVAEMPVPVKSGD